MNSTLLEFLAILGLVLANGFFAASEFSLIASRKSRIRQLADMGNKRAERTLRFLQQPDKFLAAIQVGITVIATIAGVFGGATLVESLTPLIADIPIDFISQTARPIAIVSIIIIISFLSVVLGELIPKYIALANPEKIALRVTRPISLFSKLTFVLVNFLTFSARFFLKLIGFSRLASRSKITEEEINLLVSEGTEEGVFDQTEQKLIKSVFDFGDISVHQSMTPRVDIVGIQLDWPQDKILKVMTTNGFSRYPVFGESLDNIDGVVYTKDLIKMMVMDDLVILRDILRKPLFVPDSMPLSILLRKFQKKKIHIAMVLDEFGGTDGLITLEDILEEIVGDIQDEHDYSQPEFVIHSDKVAFAAGTLRPDELNEQFGVDLPEDEAETLAGMIFDTLGRMPRPGEEVAINRIKFTVVEMAGSRIKRIKIDKI
ncbi:MAG: HlyC/CorC family transporter [FCB group bacterium]|nr:HlyC/CorC family transporter [FCB group bacterium]